MIVYSIPENVRVNRLQNRPVLSTQESGLVAIDPTLLSLWEYADGKDLSAILAGFQTREANPDLTRAGVACLAEAGLLLHSWWDFDVPMYIPDPNELYGWLSWPFMQDEIPSYHEVEPVLEGIFKEFAGPQGLENRWRRSICKAVIPG